MKKYIAPLGLVALLLTGCSSPAPSTAPETEAPTPVSSEQAPTETPVVSEPSPLPVETSAPTPTPAPTILEAETAPAGEPTTDDEAFADALGEALTPPTDAANVDPLASPEDQYLEAFYQELAALEDGPYTPADEIEALTIGYRACVALEDFGYADALLNYAFSEESTENSVANYNAALNAAPFTIC